MVSGKAIRESCEFCGWGSRVDSGRALYVSAVTWGSVLSKERTGRVRAYSL